MISNCPQCGEPVRIPKVDDHSEVRCPWCRETFLLQDVFATLPPVLEVVSQIAETSDHALQTAQSAQPPDFTSDGGEFDVADGQGETDYEFDTVAPTDFDGGRPGFVEFSSRKRLSTSRRSPDTAKRATSRSLSRAGERASRSRRKRDSPFVGFLKMAGGGVAGLLIAMLILQYMQRLPDIGIWPFRGPGVSMFGGLSPELNVPSFDNPKLTETGEPDATLSGTDLGTVDFEAMKDANLESLTTSLDSAEKILEDHFAGESEYEVSEVAKQLFDQFAIVAQCLHSMDSIPAEATLRLDAIVKSLTEDTDLLRKSLAYSFPKTEADFDSTKTVEPLESPSPGVAVLGKPFETSGGWYLGLKPGTSEGFPITLSASQVSSLTEKPILILGIIKEDTIEVAYLKEL